MKERSERGAALIELGVTAIAMLTIIFGVLAAYGMLESDQVFASSALANLGDPVNLSPYNQESGEALPFDGDSSAYRTQMRSIAEKILSSAAAPDAGLIGPDTFRCAAALGYLRLEEGIVQGSPKLLPFGVAASAGLEPEQYGEMTSCAAGPSGTSPGNLNLREEICRSAAQYIERSIGRKLLGPVSVVQLYPDAPEVTSYFGWHAFAMWGCEGDGITRLPPGLHSSTAGIVIPVR